MAESPPTRGSGPVNLELVGRTRRLLASGSNPQTTAIFTSVDPEGWPHAAWMGSTVSADMRRIYSLTSPDSRKVRNIRDNGRGEWMWVDASRETVLYLRGTTSLIEDAAELKRIWALFPDKSRSYFLSYFNTTPGYAVISTEIEEIECLMPRENQRARFTPEQIL